MNLRNSTFALVLAGGTGTRLWPRSRREHPKQLLSLFSDRTMLQDTVERVCPIIPADHIFVITNQGYVDAVRAQLPQIPPKNVLGEPVGHGTAPAIGLASLAMGRIDPEGIMVSLHADHYIERADAFRDALLQAVEVASGGHLATLGIQPSRPETGYGYIQRGELLTSLAGQPVYRVARFLEKPDAATAARFLASGEFYWNSGIFTWQLQTLWEEFSRHQPVLCGQLMEIGQAHGTPQEEETLQRVWSQMADETIDVGIMEKSDRVTVLPVEVGWSDVGNWAALLDLLPCDTGTNVVVGDHVGVDTQSSLLYSPKRLIATVGLSDMIVIDTEDAILVCPRERAQEVKHLVDALHRSNRSQYL